MKIYKLQYFLQILFIATIAFLFWGVEKTIAGYNCEVGSYQIECPYPNDCTSIWTCDAKPLTCEKIPCCISSGACTDNCHQEADCYDVKGKCTDNGYCELSRVPKGQGGGCETRADCYQIQTCENLYCKTKYVYTGTSDCTSNNDCGCDSAACIRNAHPPYDISCSQTRYRSGCIKECSSDSNCYFWTCTCNDEKCTKYPTEDPRPNDCRSGDYCTCNGPAHKVCNENHQCVLVSGSGNSECNTDAACQPKHTICKDTTSGPRCFYENGEGIDECDDHEDCESPEDNLTVTLKANPTQILKGEKTKLTYSSSDGSTTNDCIATSTDNVWEKEVTPDNEGNTSGSDEVILNEEKTYDFFYTCYDKDNKPETATASVEVGECPEGEKYPHQECIKEGVCDDVYSCGKDTCETNVECTTPPTPPTPPVCSVTLEAVPKTIFLGKTLDLKWSPIGATECQAYTSLLKENGQKITGEEIKIQGGGWYGKLLSKEDNEQLYYNTKPQSPLNSPHTSTLKPTAKGNYVYTISCDCGAEAETEITTEEEVEVKVIPVPYWREIIPVLPGFLRGLFNR